MKLLKYLAFFLLLDSCRNPNNFETCITPLKCFDMNQPNTELLKLINRKNLNNIQGYWASFPVPLAKKMGITAKKSDHLIISVGFLPEYVTKNGGIGVKNYSNNASIWICRINSKLFQERPPLSFERVFYN